MSCLPAASAADEKHNAKRDLIVFVGKRLSVTKVEPTPAPKDVMILDEEFKARYHVLHVLFGSYKAKEIACTVYDHYGEPPFAHYDTVLMFVARYKGKLYHEKYQFFPVYPTADGRWASCGSPDQWEGSYYHGRLKPVPIKFADKVADETSGQPCPDGNYVEELLLLKQNGVLKARGWIF
jgi:hypothetical protein